MRAELVKIRLVNGVILPTAPPKLIFPTVPARSVRGTAPFTVLEKLIVAPVAVPPVFVVSKVGVPVTVTGPVRVITPPFVLMLVVVIALPVALNEERAVVPPTIPVNVTDPAPAATLSAFAPLIVLLKPALAPFVVIVLPPVRLTACPKVRGLAPDTVMFAPTWMRDELVKTRLVNGVVLPTAPVKVIVPVPFAVNVKACAPSIAPPNEIEPANAPVVLIVEEFVRVVGEAVVIVKEDDVILPPILTALAVVFAFVIVRLPKAVPPPITPPKVTDPVDPARRAKVCVLATVPSMVAPEPEKLIEAPVVVTPLLVASMLILADKIVLPLRVIAPPCVVRLAPNELPKEPAPPPAVPDKLNGPVFVKAEATLIP